MCLSKVGRHRESVTRKNFPSTWQANCWWQAVDTTGSDAHTCAVPSLRKSKKTSSRGRSFPLGPQSLLILHLNADKLRADGLYLGELGELCAALATVGFDSEAVRAEATTHSQLMSVLAELASTRRTFDVIVVVAHSNATGIRIAADRPLAGWAEFAKYLKPFRPRRLLLAACQAGRWDAGEALFTDNTLLRRIYACPVNASRDFAAIMLAAVPYVVATRRPADKHVLWSQFAAVAFTGRQLREWRRVTDKGNPDSAVYDLVADLLHPYAREIPTALGVFLRAVAGKK